MTRFLLTVQYLGTRYAGWQSQQNAEGVQDLVEKALETMCRTPVRIHGAGRTDAGVHARGQRAHVDLEIEIEPYGLVQGLNTMLPDDIRIVEARIVPEDFHARYHAKSKRYAYRIWNDDVADVFHSRTHALVKGRLDESLIRRAAEILEGPHDFQAFTVTNRSVKTTEREIHSIKVRRDGKRIEIEIRGDGFLRYMVRRIAGLLIEVGLGRISPEETARFLEPELAEVRWSAPAEGLTLESVEYGGEG